MLRSSESPTLNGRLAWTPCVRLCDSTSKAKAMEEWIGEHWHRLAARAADRSFAAQGVTLESMQRPVGLLFRAAGCSG